MNYSYYFIEEVNDVSDISYDIFISAFDGCHRTLETYGKIISKMKYWLLFPQYSFPNTMQLPQNALFSEEVTENGYINAVVDQMANLNGSRICIDSTGFIIPHLMFLMMLLKRKGVKEYHILYSSPIKYSKDESTVFSIGANQTRPIIGYSSSPKNVNGDDVLILLAGFNDTLLTNVARDKSKSKYKYLFVGFPPLQADMYQQSILQLNKSKETIGKTNVYYCKAPAYDPFISASKIQKEIDRLGVGNRQDIGFIHIAPLSTKPMAIAAALVYMKNPDLPIDVVYPTSDSYMCDHSEGISRTWRYIIEY